MIQTIFSDDGFETKVETDGYVCAAGEVAFAVPIPGEDALCAAFPGRAVRLLALEQSAACSRINATAEALCSNLITPGQTQQTRYARKLAQAEAFLQDGTPTEAEYPLIYNEVGITAKIGRAHV